MDDVAGHMTGVSADAVKEVGGKGVLESEADEGEAGGAGGHTPFMDRGVVAVEDSVSIFDVDEIVVGVKAGAPDHGEVPEGYGCAAWPVQMATFGVSYAV